jgi:hypothetical protein
LLRHHRASTIDSSQFNEIGPAAPDIDMSSSEIKRRLLLNAAPLLLVVVACGQRYLAYAYGLTSWHGGGFGMFATIPATETRKLTVTLIAPDGSDVRIPPLLVESRIPLRGRMTRIQRETLAFPAESRLRALAEELANAEWIGVRQTIGTTSVVFPQVSTDYTGNRAETTPFPLAAVTVTVWEYDLDSAARRLVRRELISVTAQARGAKHGLRQ